MSTNSISDDVIKVQVNDYLKTLEFPMQPAFLGRNSSFTEHFEVLNIDVKDKMLKEKECTVICKITFKAKEDWSHEGAYGLFKHIVGAGSIRAGESKTNEAKFLFDKFDKGWKIRGYV